MKFHDCFVYYDTFIKTFLRVLKYFRGVTVANMLRVRVCTYDEEDKCQAIVITVACPGFPWNLRPAPCTRGPTIFHIRDQWENRKRGFIDFAPIYRTVHLWRTFTPGKESRPRYRRQLAQHFFCLNEQINITTPCNIFRCQIIIFSFFPIVFNPSMFQGVQRTY